MTLETYLRKRRFDQTPEPPGESAPAGRARPKDAGRPLRFVVQEHHATRLHWDLRLEMAGVLRSWAIPKGPSLDPADKRLAVLVEDHPIEYGEFEGVIPPGNYGAGTVLLWDRGTYTCREGDPEAAFERGKLTIDFAGERLRGEFHFVRTKRNEGRDWLLFKGKDEYAEPGFVPVGRPSVATGRTIEEIAGDRGSRWTSGPPGERQRTPPTAGRTNVSAAPAEPTRTKGRTRAPSPKGGRSARRGLGTDLFPRPFKPMLAEQGRAPFDRAGWSFEVKWDGVRALAFVRREGAAQEIVLYGRSLRRLNPQFPEVVDALAGLDVASAVLDGEIFASDDEGRPSFHRLQQRLHLNAAAGERPAVGEVHVAYAVFDCLYLDGRDLRDRPFAERRAALEALALPAGLIKPDAIPERGTALFEAARRLGFEGIVAKKLASPYRPGARSADWVKVKIRRTLEAVVGGLTRGRGGRSTSFGALVLGQYDECGALVHIGQTGGGFSDADLAAFRRRLSPLETKTPPFVKRPDIPGPITWVRPEVVVEVEYGEWTPDGLLRFPIFVRLRDDVTAREVRLQRPVAGAAGAAAAEEPNGSRVGAALAASAAPREPSGAGREPVAPRKGGTVPAQRAAARRTPAAAHSVDTSALPPEIAFTNLDKVFFPGTGYTKGDVVEYYRRIAPYIVPHLMDRPLTLRRWPDGIDGEDFFQKDMPQVPPFVRTLRVWSDQGDRDIQFIVGADEKLLLWLAQMGCIEMHPWFSRVTPIPGRGVRRPTTTFSGSEAAIEGSTLNYPDFVVFDVDPFIFPAGQKPVVRHGEKDPEYSRRGFAAARQATFWVRDALEGLGLRAFVKTSGKTGMHVLVPIKRRYTYAQTHAFAKTLVEWLTAQHPDELTTAWAVEQRVGKVFLDYNQNVRGKTMASVYSLRPIPEAAVSMPVTWEELEAGFDPLQWTIETVFDRLARTGDVWAHILDAAQELHLDRGSRPGR